MRTKQYRYFSCDFETTVYEGQESTEVWASACVELFTEDVHVHHSIDETFEFLKSLKSHVVCYYHNLKFDGSFWLDFLLRKLEFKQAYTAPPLSGKTVEWLPEKAMQNNTFKYSISDKGQWYSMVIKVNDHFIEIRDSLKLLPFSVKRIGDAFKTKHRKLDMEYKGLRYAGCPITSEEMKYIENDVLVVKEALEIMFNEGNTRLTIGSCCLAEYKRICKTSLVNEMEYDDMFPDLTAIPLEESFRYKSVDEYIRRSYRGGWCYLVKGRENKMAYDGSTFDVNSLYPSMMHSESGNEYPVNMPEFWHGDYIPDEALARHRYYFVRIKTRFYLKEGYLPFIQIKNSFAYCGTESLETSDIYDESTGEYYTHWTDKDGKIHDTRVELVLTCTDFNLIKEHYDLVDCEVLDGCYFRTQIGIFDEYIDKYKERKMTSKGAKRELAKLFLNNLYGKMASSTDSSFKVAYMKEDGNIGFIPVSEKNKKAGYIAVGSAITSYARNFTIRSAQKNFHGHDSRGFIYADTDSIHCDLQPDEVRGVTVHPSAFCCWKAESCWDKAIFVRQKTYIEHITHEDCEPVETPYHNIKCAGMPQRAKNYFALSMDGTAEYSDEMEDDVKEFLFTEDGVRVIRDYSDFTRGLKVPGKLLPKRVYGGIVLKETEYEIR